VNNHERAAEADLFPRVVSADGSPDYARRCNSLKKQRNYTAMHILRIMQIELVIYELVAGIQET
jgi:hypothetical protein